MLEFVQILKTRNETLFYFGLICFVWAIIFIALTKFSSTQVYNISAWYKPFKFAVSIGMYAWTMAWFCHYLPNFNITLFNWATIVLLGLELLYIGVQAQRGQLSHYNVSSPFYGGMYVFMALAASLVATYTAYVGLLFFQQDFPELPDYYLWAIRLGIIIFVVFSFEGFVMGSRLTHTIGGLDGEASLPVLNWSTKYGDPRIAHFIGMHALQVLPLLAFYVLKSTKATIMVSILYGFLAVFTLAQALQGKPFIRVKQAQHDIVK